MAFLAYWVAVGRILMKMSSLSRLNMSRTVGLITSHWCGDYGNHADLFWPLWEAASWELAEHQLSRPLPLPTPLSATYCFVMKLVFCYIFHHSVRQLSSFIMCPSSRQCDSKGQCFSTSTSWTFDRLLRNLKAVLLFKFQNISCKSKQ